MKRWCKRPPAPQATGAAGQTPPGARPRGLGVRVGPAWAFEGCPPEPTGRPHEAVGNGSPRWMAAEGDPGDGPLDRTRLTGRLIRALAPHQVSREAPRSAVGLATVGQPHWKSTDRAGWPGRPVGTQEEPPVWGLCAASFGRFEARPRPDGRPTGRYRSIWGASRPPRSGVPHRSRHAEPVPACCTRPARGRGGPVRCCGPGRTCVAPASRDTGLALHPRRGSIRDATQVHRRDPRGGRGSQGPPRSVQHVEAHGSQECAQARQTC